MVTTRTSQFRAVYFGRTMTILWPDIQDATKLLEKYSLDFISQG